MPDESVEEYVSRFRGLQSRCTANLTDVEFVRLAQAGLKFELQKQFVGHNFYDLCHMVTVASNYEKILDEEKQRKASSKGTYYRNQISQVEYIDGDTDVEEQAEVAIAELEIKSKKPYVCKDLTKSNLENKKFSFDVTKTEKIFDLLLQDKQIKLPEGHVMPTPEKLKGKKYCKWHDKWSHYTNECYVLRSALQKAIEDGKMQFSDAKEEKKQKMPVNCVSVAKGESISPKQIAAQDGVYLNLKHPEVKQRYVDAEVMQEYADNYGKTLFCMRCACDLAVPAVQKKKDTDKKEWRDVVKAPVTTRLSYPKPSKPSVSVRTPVAQTNGGLFYDRNTDAYYQRKSVYGQYGSHGQPVFKRESRAPPRRDTDRPRMVKPSEPKDNRWHKNISAKDKGKFKPETLTRTQLRRVQRLYGQKKRAQNGQDSKAKEDLKIHNPYMPASEVHREPPPDAVDVLKDLQEKSEKLEQEKIELQSKLKSKEEDLYENLTDDEFYDEFSDGIQFGSMPKAAVNMAFTLPAEFKASGSSSEASDTDATDVEDEAVLSLNLTNAEVISRCPFDKPTKEMIDQVKPLYIKAKFDGKPVGRVLIDNGAAINIIPVSTMRKLGKTKEDLYEPIMSITNFAGGVEKPVGMLPIEVNVGNQKSTTAFYVIETSNVGYNALLGRDWIHSNQCIPSSLHQALAIWDGDDIEIVKADDQPFSRCVNMAEAVFYNGDTSPINCEDFENGTFKKVMPDTEDMALEASDIDLFK